MKFPTMNEFAKSVAEKALDEFEYKGKTLREWVKIILATDINVGTKDGTNLAEVGTDCISRKAVIEVIADYPHGDWNLETMHEMVDMVKQLPPIQPKKGKWIKTARWGRVYYCDQCRNYLDFDGVNAGRGSTNFCPNCGADMRGEQNG